MLTDRGKQILAKCVWNEPAIGAFVTLHDLAREILAHGDVMLAPGDSACVHLVLMGYEVGTVEVRMTRRDAET